MVLKRVGEQREPARGGVPSAPPRRACAPLRHARELECVGGGGGAGSSISISEPVGLAAVERYEVSATVERT
jgi:hypothetical protein